MTSSSIKIFICVILLFLCGCGKSFQLPIDQHNEALKIIFENTGIVTDDPCGEVGRETPFLCSGINTNNISIHQIIFDNRFFEFQRNYSLFISSDLTVFKDVRYISIATPYTVTSEFYHNLYKFNKLYKVEIDQQNLPINNNITLNPYLNEIVFREFNTSIPEGFLRSPTLKSFSILNANSNFKFPQGSSGSGGGSGLTKLLIPLNSYSANTISFDLISNYFTNLEIFEIRVKSDYYNNNSSGNELPEFSNHFKKLKRLHIVLPYDRLFNIPNSINNLKSSLLSILIEGQIKVNSDKPIFDFSNFRDQFQLSLVGNFSTLPTYRPLVLLPKNSTLETMGLNYSFKVIDFSNITQFSTYSNKFKNTLPDDDAMDYDSFISLIIRPSNKVSGGCPQGYSKIKFYILPMSCIFEHSNSTIITTIDDESHSSSSTSSSSSSGTQSLDKIQVSTSSTIKINLIYSLIMILICLQFSYYL